MATSISIGLVDDDDAHAQRLMLHLAQAGYDARRFDAADSLAAFANDRGPTCAILELAFGDECGLDAQERLRAQAPHVAVLFLTGSGDVRSCAEAMRCGAVDFLEKPVDRVALQRALALAAAQSHARWMARLDRDRQRARLARLTPREMQVLQLVLAGRRNKQIAASLGSEESTVKVHRSRLMRKLEARSLADVFRLNQQMDALQAIDEGSASEPAQARRAAPLLLARTHLDS